MIEDNRWAVNKEHFQGFFSSLHTNCSPRVGICVKFKDGASTSYQFQKPNYFNKKGIYNLRKLLKNNGFEPSFGDHEVADFLIDNRIVENNETTKKCVIAELKNKTEKNLSENIML